MKSSYTYNGTRAVTCMITGDDDAVSTPDDPVTDISTSASLTDNDETVDDEPPTPWEPPPGFCWICWTDNPGLVCSKHPK